MDLDLEDLDIDFKPEFENLIVVPAASDHSILNNRDADDQHPIKAVTGLRGELDSRASKEELEPKLDKSELIEVSNLELQALWNKLIK